MFSCPPNKHLARAPEYRPVIMRASAYRLFRARLEPRLHPHGGGYGVDCNETGKELVIHVDPYEETLPEEFGRPSSMLNPTSFRISDFGHFHIQKQQGSP